MGEDGTIYQVLANDRKLYAINPDDGTIRWAVDLSQAAAGDPNMEADDWYLDGWTEPALGPDGTVYASLGSPYLVAINRDSTVKWIQRLGNEGAYTCAVDNEGMIYAVSADGFIYVLDALGQLKSLFETDQYLSYPSITAPGMLLVTAATEPSVFQEQTVVTQIAISDVGGS